MSANIIPSLVYAIRIPNLPKNAPSQPLVVVRCVSAIPATAVGSANGSSIIPFIICLPGKLYLTRTHARIVPITASISAAINAVSRLTL